MLRLFSVNRLMHLKNIVEFCIVFGAAELENVIGIIDHQAPERFSRT